MQYSVTTKYRTEHAIQNSTQKELKFATRTYNSIHALTCVVLITMQMFGEQLSSSNLLCF